MQLISKSTNPRDVAIIFRQYARLIHKKVARDDPNLLKLSIACGKVSASLCQRSIANEARSSNGPSITTRHSFKYRFQAVALPKLRSIPCRLIVERLSSRQSQRPHKRRHLQKSVRNLLPNSERRVNLYLTFGPDQIERVF